MTQSKEFELPPQLSISAAKDEISQAEVVQRVFRDAVRRRNPLACPDSPFFVLSFDLWENRLYVAGSFIDPENAIAFARRETHEAAVSEDAGRDAFVTYYPFDKSGNLLDPTK